MIDRSQSTFIWHSYGRTDIEDDPTPFEEMTVRSTRLPRILTILFAFALLAAACGDDDTTDDTSDGEEESSGDTTGGDTVAAAAGGDIDRSDWPDTLRMAAVPSAEEDTQIERYQPIIDILTEELGIEIEFSFATSYSAVIESMIAKNLDMAGFGPFSYVIATGNGADLVPVAIRVSDGEEPSYRSYGITQAGNDDIDSIEDFAGRNVCFVDPGSTSGFLFPSSGLLEAGIDPESGVTGTFAGGHDASALSVANGTCEAGFAYDRIVTTQLIEAGDLHGVIDTVEDESVNEDEAELKIVWKSPDIPSSPTVVQADLPQSLIDEIERIYTEVISTDTYIERGVCDSVEDCTRITGDDGSISYLPVEDSLYDGVREVCELTGSAECEL